MSSLLALFWSSREKTATRVPQPQVDAMERTATRDSPPSSPPILAASSSSGDATLEGDSKDNYKYLILKYPQLPSTPEGLQVRRSVQQLKQELILPRTSFTAAASQPAQVRPTIPSPPVSTSNFYGPYYGDDDEEDHDNDSGVASSPILVPGKARTAVGALVAAQQLQNQSGNLASEEEQVNLSFSARTNTSYILPPPWTRDEIMDLSIHSDDFPYQQVLNESNILPLDAIEQMRTPERPRHTIQQQRSMVHHDDEDDDQYSMISSCRSGSTNQSSLARRNHNTSMTSSRVALIPMSTLNDDNSQRIPYDLAPIHTAEVMLFPDPNTVVPNHHDISAMTVEDVILYPFRRVMSQDAAEYDEEMDQREGFCSDSDRYALPVHGDDDLVAAHTLLQQVPNTRQNVDLFLAIVERFQDDLNLLDQLQQMQALRVDASSVGKTPLDQEGLLTGFSKHVRDKIVNQLKALLVELERTVMDNDDDDPNQQLSLRHKTLYDALHFCQALVEMAIPEGEKATMMRTQDEMEAAMMRWKFRDSMRAAIGILEPVSPEVVRRGGDTSVFSLPSDSAAETPMTSNVSVTTTITSAVTTNTYSPRRTGATQPYMPSGLQVRRTMELVASIVQRLTLACWQMSHLGLEHHKSGGSHRGDHRIPMGIRITQEIKALYAQVLKLDFSDLKAVSDAFDCELHDDNANVWRLSTHIPRQVSNDDHDAEADWGAPPPCRPILPRMSLPQVYGERMRPQDQQPAFHQARTTGSVQFSSPSTDDMRTWRNEDNDCGVKEEDSASSNSSFDDENNAYDDLRRQMGSNDYDEDDDCDVREGPPIPVPIPPPLGMESWKQRRQVLRSKQPPPQQQSNRRGGAME